MKQLLSLFLSLAMVVSLAVTPVYATDIGDDGISLTSTEEEESSESSTETETTYDASNGVASVTVNDVTTYYGSLADAIAEATEDSIVTLLKDDSGGGIVIGETEGQCNFTIDLNSKTYTFTDAYGGVSLNLKAGAGDLVIKNGTIVVDDNGSALQVIFSYCDLTLEDVTISVSESSENVNCVLWVMSGTVAITGSTTITANDYADAICVDYSGSAITVTIDSEDVTINGGISYIYYSYSTEEAAENAKLLISAGTINGVLNTPAGETGIEITGGTFSDENASEYLADGYTVTANEDGSYTVTVAEVVYVAQIGDTQYETLTAAFDAAVTGDTITLLQEEVVDETGDTDDDGVWQVDGITVTLDLGGYTLTSNAKRMFGVLNGGKLTVKNGSVTSNYSGSTIDNTLIVTRTASKFYAEDVAFNAGDTHYYLIWAAAGGIVELTDCTISGATNAVVKDNADSASVMLEGCGYTVKPVSGNGSAMNYWIYITNQQSSISAENGSYEIDDSGVVRLDCSYVVFDGGSITTDGTIYVRNNLSQASLSVCGGTVSAAGIEVRDNTALFDEEVNDGDPTVSVTGNITVKAGGLLIFVSGTVSVGGQFYSEGSIELVGGTVTGTASKTNGLIYAKSGTINAYGGTVTTTDTRGIVIDDGVTGYIEAVSVTATDIGLLTRGTGVTISGGAYTATTGLYTKDTTVIANGYGVYDSTYNETLAANANGEYKSEQDDQTVYVMTADTAAAASDMFTKDISLDSGKVTLNVYAATGSLRVYSVTASLEDEDELEAEVATTSTGYTISQKISAEKMANTLTVTVTLQSGEVITYTTSVKAAANAYLAMDSTSENCKNILTAMLDFGSAVQEFYGYKTDNLANGSSYDEDAIEAVDLTAVKAKAPRYTDILGSWDSGNKLSSVNMYCDDYDVDLTLTYTFDLTDYEVTMTLGGVEYTDIETDGKVLTISGLGVKQLNETMYVTVSDGNGNSYGTETTGLYYVRLVLTNSSDTNKQVQAAKTIFLYARALA